MLIPLYRVFNLLVGSDNTDLDTKILEAKCDVDSTAKELAQLVADDLIRGHDKLPTNYKRVYEAARYNRNIALTTQWVNSLPHRRELFALRNKYLDDADGPEDQYEEEYNEMKCMLLTFNLPCKYSNMGCTVGTCREDVYQ